MCVPAPSNHKPWARSHRPGKLGALRQFGFPVLQRGGRWLLRIGKGVVEGYLSRKRGNAAAGERLAEAMMRYAELCMSAGGTPQDLDEAATYLDRAASLYAEMGRSEDAAQALALKARTGLAGDEAGG